jgi:hypothetical protein
MKSINEYFDQFENGNIPALEFETLQEASDFIDEIEKKFKNGMGMFKAGFTVLYQTDDHKWTIVEKDNKWRIEYTPNPGIIRIV